MHIHVACYRFYSGKRKVQEEVPIGHQECHASHVQEDDLTHANPGGTKNLGFSRFMCGATRIPCSWQFFYSGHFTSSMQLQQKPVLWPVVPQSTAAEGSLCHFTWLISPLFPFEWIEQNWQWIQIRTVNHGNLVHQSAWLSWNRVCRNWLLHLLHAIICTDLHMCSLGWR